MKIFIHNLFMLQSRKPFSDIHYELKNDTLLVKLIIIKNDTLLKLVKAIIIITPCGRGALWEWEETGVGCGVLYPRLRPWV